MIAMMVNKKLPEGSFNPTQIILFLNNLLPLWFLLFENRIYILLENNCCYKYKPFLTLSSTNSLVSFHNSSDSSFINFFFSNTISALILSGL